MKQQSTTERTQTPERHTTNMSETSATETTQETIDRLQKIVDAIDELSEWMEEEDLVAQEQAELGESA
jgi:hypothetical protein